MARITRWLRRLALFAALALGLGLLALGILYWLVAPRLPDVQELRNVALQVPLSVYSSDGKLIAQFGETRRYPVKVGKIPLQVKQAFIAIEDARFYQHQGLDFRGISRAIWLLATTDNARVPGGSTITQQVAKNFYLSSEYSYSRKLMEMLLALKMERELAKDEILELYLNKIFFGNRAYGVVAAAEFYFGKPLDAADPGRGRGAGRHPEIPVQRQSDHQSEPQHRPAQLRAAAHARGRLHHRRRRKPRRAPSRAAPARTSRRSSWTRPTSPRWSAQAMGERYGAESETSGFRVFTTVQSTDQLAADQAVRDGLVEYDRRHGWRGAEAHLDLAAGETTRRPRARACGRFLFISGMPVGVVTSVVAGQGQRADAAPATPIVARRGSRAKWTGRTPGRLLKRGDVVRVCRPARSRASSS